MASPYNPFSLDGRLILVTGASSGIGRAVAVECSRMGGQMVLVARRKAELYETADMLHGANHHVVPADLLRGEELASWLIDLAAKCGPFAGLVHSAGISLTMPIKATSASIYRDIMSINLDTSYWLIKGFRQKKVHAPSSSVVLMGSVSGTVGAAGLSAYCASKGGLIGLAQAAALELIRDGVRVNVISPALVETQLAKNYSAAIPEESKMATLADHPMGIGRPQDVANAAVYLLSDASRWVTGINLMVDGGYTAR